MYCICTAKDSLYVISSLITLTAGEIEERTVNGGDPEVRRARVKQHSEVLRRGADADVPIVLSLRRQESA